MKLQFTLLLFWTMLSLAAAAASEPPRAEAKRPAYLGMSFTHHASTPGRQQSWLTVQNIEPGAAAERAGLKRGDLIIQISGRAIKSSPYEVLVQLAEFQAGEMIKLTILRDRQQKVIEILGDRMPDRVLREWKANLSHTREEYERSKQKRSAGEPQT